MRRLEKIASGGDEQMDKLIDRVIISMGKRVMREKYEGMAVLDVVQGSRFDSCHLHLVEDTRK